MSDSGSLDRGKQAPEPEASFDPNLKSESRVDYVQ